jgi:hypothetical protein
MGAKSSSRRVAQHFCIAGRDHRDRNRGWKNWPETAVEPGADIWTACCMVIEEQYLAV